MICHFIESQTVFYPFVSYFVCEGATDRKRVFCFDHETQATRDALFVGLLIALLAVKKGKKLANYIRLNIYDSARAADINW